MPRTFLLIALFFYIICAGNTIAQSASIAVNVSSSGTALDAATVSLLNATDSSWIKSAMTDDKGSAQFNALTPGKYIVTATSVGYKQSIQPLEIKEDITYTCAIELEKESTSLNEVAITAKKPFIEMSVGKITVNIEGSTTTAASNALDLMRRLPGVSVDQNGVISMSGKAGVLVLVDDRPTYLSGEDLAAYLKTITADEIAQIELITQPGARYDAAGNGGVINIKLKKNKKEGWNGYVNGTYGEGIYFRREESFLLSYKKNKLNVSLNGSDLQGKGFADWNENLYYIDNQTGVVTAKSVVQSHAVERYSNSAVRLAADYDCNDKTTIGVSARGSYHPNSMPYHVLSADSDLFYKSLSYQDITAKDFSIREDIMANAYLSHKFGKDHTLDINFDYLTFLKPSDQYYANSPLDDNKQLIAAPSVISSSQPVKIHVYSIKADYEKGFTSGLKLDAGLKASAVNTDYNGSFSQLINNNWVNDTGMTNHFVYRENIYAVYIAASKSFGKKWEARAGLRAEETQAEGTQYVHYSTFSRNYLSPFPTAYLDYKMDSSNQFELNYGRRIDRPAYSYLNPFAYYTFQNTYQQGNPNLQPQYTNNVQLKHSYKNMLLTTITYSSTTDVMADILEVRGANRSVYNVEENLASNNYIAGSLTFNKDIFKWCSINATASVFKAEYSGLIDSVNKTVRLSGYSLNGSGQFDMGKGWRSEFYINYFSAGRRDINESFDAHVYMEFGLLKKVSEKLTVRANANDPFWLDQIHSHNDAGNFHEDVLFRYASQFFSMSLTYNFGSRHIEQNEKQIDEARRL